MIKKRTSFTPQTLSYPPIFKIQLVVPSELEGLYTNAILGSAPVSEVNECMVKYVTSLVEPRDWRAIWRTTEWGLNSPGAAVCDFIVEVIDVSRNALEATVSIEKLLYPPLQGNDLNEEEKANVEKLISRKIVQVALTELYVINEDDSDEYSVTAVTLEHVRFFYRHIWRPWDDVISRPQITSFCENYLANRLKLHFDIKSGDIDSTIVERIHYLLEEGTRLRARFDEVNRRMDAVNQGLDGGDWGTNENIRVGDFDLYESLRLQMKLEDFDLEMSRLEDPLLRTVMMICNKPTKSEDIERVHIVAVDLSLVLLEKVVNFLKSNPRIGASSDQLSRKSPSPLVFHQDLPSAFSTARSGDSILLLPGNYPCITNLWITENISVLGIKETSEDVIIESNQPSGEIFLHCASEEIFITNLTLRTADPSQGILQVHFGQTRLKECILDGGQCCTSLSGQLLLTECTIPHPFTLGGSENSIKIIESNFSDSVKCAKHSASP